MQSDLPPLAWLRAFEAAARHENFTEAGAQLGLTQAAISQQIRKLEGVLGVSLFRRLPRGVELTADGAAYLPHVRAAFDQLERSTRDLFVRRRKRRVVRLAAPASFTSLWLAPHLPDFSRAHPEIELTIASIHRPADYDSERSDLEVRLGAGPWPGREALFLYPEVMIPACAPTLLDQCDKKQWQDLPKLAVIGHRGGWAEWCRAASCPPPAEPVHRFDSFMPALQAAMAGAGVLLVSDVLTRDALRRGHLVRLSETSLVSAASSWLLRPSNQAVSPEVMTVWHWLGDRTKNSVSS
ncbi:LysR substrate-binding domain-containing protein [Coralliovum pocilloporae]|uniref:LysR substrate-binding domain-containing protein n=1 Tax=Coralliovum pocilloporae TaxID=3066369 RepID=UPI003306EBBF